MMLNFILTLKQRCTIHTDRSSKDAGSAPSAPGWREGGARCCQREGKFVWRSQQSLCQVDVPFGRTVSLLGTQLPDIFAE